MDELEAIKQMFAGLTEEQRQEIVADYCHGCWIWNPDRNCRCQDDE